MDLSENKAGESRLKRVLEKTAKADSKSVSQQKVKDRNARFYSLPPALAINEKVIAEYAEEKGMETSEVSNIPKGYFCEFDYSYEDFFDIIEITGLDWETYSESKKQAVANVRKKIIGEATKVVVDKQSIICQAGLSPYTKAFLAYLKPDISPKEDGLYTEDFLDYSKESDVRKDSRLAPDCHPATRKSGRWEFEAIVAVKNFLSRNTRLRNAIKEGKISLYSDKKVAMG